MFSAQLLFELQSSQDSPVEGPLPSSPTWLLQTLVTCWLMAAACSSLFHGPLQKLLERPLTWQLASPEQVIQERKKVSAWDGNHGLYNIITDRYFCSVLLLAKWEETTQGVNKEVGNIESHFGGFTITLIAFKKKKEEYRKEKGIKHNIGRSSLK